MQNKDKGKIKILYGKWQECGFICSLLCEGDKFSDVKCIIKNYGLNFQDTLKKKKEKNKKLPWKIYQFLRNEKPSFFYN